MEAYKKVLISRRETRSLMNEESLSSFREAFGNKKRKPDIAKASKYSNKVKAFSVDQYDALVGQLDVLNLNKFDNEIIQAIMQYVSEGKKIKESDIPIIAKFIIEVIRRYPSTVEMLETAFQESLKVIGTTKLAIAQTIKKNLFLLYCELCLCGIVGKEAMVGKMLKAMVEAVSSSETPLPVYNDIIQSFIKLYSYEYAGIIPSFLFGENGKSLMDDCSPIVSPSIQSRILPIVESYYSYLHKGATALWSKYSKHYQMRIREEAFRGSSPEGLAAKVEKESAQMEQLKQELHIVCQYCNHEDPVFVMEEEEETVDDHVMIVERNDRNSYSGPFADVEEEIFYRVVPNLEELVPSLYSKKGKKATEETGSTESSQKDEPAEVVESLTVEEAEMEAEMEEMEATAVEEDEGEEIEEVEDVGDLKTTPGMPQSYHLSELKDISIEEKGQILMDRLMGCFSAKEIDDWCLEFCTINNETTRSMLVDTIHGNYVRHIANQPYFARAIKELKPAYDSLDSEVEVFVRNRFYSLTVTMAGRDLPKLMSVSEFIIELVRFDVFKPVLFFYCLRRLWRFRTLESIQVIVLFVEKLAPILLTRKAIAPLVNSELNRIHALCNERVVDSNCSALLMNAYYICRPSERPRVKRVEVPPQQRYIQYLLNDRLVACRDYESQSEIASHILRYNLKDTNTLMMIVHEILKVPANSYISIEALVLLCCELNYQYKPFGVVLLDTIYEKLMMILDFMPGNIQQEALGLVQFIYLLYDFRMISNNAMYFILYLLIEYGHNVTQDAIDHYSFLPKRPMAVHPLVYYENDSPYMVLRLKMAIKLFTLCSYNFKTKRERTYLLYLQRYFLSKAEVDLETIYDYEELMNRSDKIKKYSSFEEVDNAIASIEMEIIKSGRELKPYTFMISMQQEENDSLEAAPAVLEKEVTPVKEPEKDEIELQLEKKLAEQMKGGSSNAPKRVNLDGMAIPMNLHNSGNGNHFKLLIKTKSGVVVGNTINVTLSEAEKERRKNLDKMKKKQARVLKEKTILLNTQEEEPQVGIQSIHNERIPVVPQANSRRYKY